MKKKNLLILIIIIAFLIICGLTLKYLSKNTNNTNNDINNEDQTTLSTTEDEIAIYTEPEYVDENPVKLGIYVQNGSSKTLITEKYTCSFAPENVMGVFFAVPTTDLKLPNTSFDTLWKSYIEDYPNSKNYRIGYNISFTLNTGEVIDRTILNPDDAYHMFPKVMVFLYDDVNLVPGKKYYHITNS